MTARHVIKGACRVKVDIANHWIEGPRWTFWHKGGRGDEVSADVATIRLASPAPGHVYSIRTSSASVGMNLTALGHPLGNDLSITQGHVYAKGQQLGIPMLAVRLLGAEGASGAPFVDDTGAVAGILQLGLGKSDALGQRTSGIVLGIDLPSWWSTVRADLCRAYPNGGVLYCSTDKAVATKPPVPPQPPKSPVCTPAPNADCSGVDLSNVSFSGRDLRGANFSNADLQNADFSNANLQYAIFQHATLDGADFTNADLTSTDFSRAIGINPAAFVGVILCNTLLPDGTTHQCGSASPPTPLAKSPAPTAAPSALVVGHIWVSHTAGGPGVQFFSWLAPAIYVNADFAPVSSPTAISARWTDPFGGTLAETLTVQPGSATAHFSVVPGSYFQFGRWNVRIFRADGTELADRPFTVG
jgi:hypothetical protein